MRNRNGHQPRRILFLQDHETTGGAAVAAQRYASALQDLGLEVETASGDGQTRAGFHLLTGKVPRGFGRILEVLLPKPVQAKIRQARVARSWPRLISSIKPDLIWVHNLQGGLKWGWSPELLPVALRAGPVLWTLHDMWSLGDGPAYFDEVKLHQNPKPALLSRVFADFAAKHHLRITAPSQWLCRLAQKTAPGSCQHLAYVLNPLDFDPGRRDQARKNLGLRKRDFFLITVAENLRDPRKGLDLLEKAWLELRAVPDLDGLGLGLVGRGNFTLLQGDPRVRVLRSAVPDGSLAAWMAAADLLVHPASLDNFPLVLHEAQACGTPVLAFDRGGIRETFEPGRTGWLLQDRSSSALAKKILEIAGNPAQAANMRTRARARILELQAKENFSRAWQNLVSTYPEGSFGGRLGRGKPDANPTDGWEGP